MAEAAPAVVSQTPLTPADDTSPPEAFTQRLAREKHELALSYARWIKIVASAQILAINLFFLIYGTGYLWWGIPFKPQEDMFKYFTVSVFAEVLLLALIVTRNLFPGSGGWLENVLSFLSLRRGA